MPGVGPLRQLEPVVPADLRHTAMPRSPSAASTAATPARDAHVHRDLDLGGLRRLVGIVDPGHVRELAAAGAGVEALRVAALALLQRRRDPDLEERQAGVGVQVADHVAARAVGRHQRHDDDDAGVGHQAGDLGGAADVLLARRVVEAEVAAQPVAQVVAVEPVGVDAALGQRPHQLAGHGRLARGGQAGEPDGRAAAAEQRLALLALQRLPLPDDVLGVRALEAHESRGPGSSRPRPCCWSPRRSG